MFKDLNISHLTGSVSVQKNHFFHDEVTPRARRTVSQMFFQPYESRKEFIFCARRIICPMVLLGTCIYDPIMALGSILATVFLCSLVSSSTEGSTLTSKLITSLLQNMLDLLVLPIALIMMLTRSIASGLKAVGILKPQTPEAPADAEFEPVLSTEEQVQADEDGFDDQLDFEIVQETPPGGPRLA